MKDAARITRAMGGAFRHGQGLAPCPICQPEARRDQRALSITEKAGRVLLHCHKSGCNAHSEIRRRGLAPLAQAAGEKDAERERHRDRARRRKATDHANRIFELASCAAGTPVATYLAARGLRYARLERMQRTLRFHPCLTHGPTGMTFPAMVARVREVGGYPLGIHRTFLAADGAGKAAVTPSKMMLGPTAGGAVRFGPDAPKIVLAEGIETALSICASARVTTWACLSATGLKSIELPPPPVAEVVVIAADNDPAGLAAAEALAARLDREGRAASIITPPERGQDFNDMFRATA